MSVNDLDLANWRLALNNAPVGAGICHQRRCGHKVPSNANAKQSTVFKSLPRRLPVGIHKP